MTVLTERQCAVSVCLATYNGSAFLREQVASILPQLGTADEVIAVDDASSDDTVAILDSFRDPRIRILCHPVNRGVTATFEHALSEARGEIIFLCDQDDVWHPEKVAKVQQVFEKSPEVTLVISNAEIIDVAGVGTGRKTECGKEISLGVTANLIKNRYRGCTMAFRRRVLEVILPFPKRIPMHDSWIGIANAIVGKAEYIAEPLVRYRRHSRTVTCDLHGSIAHMAVQRWHLLKAILCRSSLLFRFRRSLRSISTVDGSTI